MSFPKATPYVDLSTAQSINGTKTFNDFTVLKAFTTPGNTNAGILSLGIGANSFLQVTPTNETAPFWVWKNNAAQTVDVWQVQNSAGTPIVRVLPAGSILAPSIGDLGGTTGINFGASAIGFFGHPAAAQPAAITLVATTASTAVTPVGYTTTAQADSIPVAINAIITALKSIGITL